ncbi:hypothetical protein ABID08_006550 [Rhizobium binae]|uniref:Uncharacterized protein n=1 Tax=Rhizobium binae TaxID=1138190 RepID=A0ABV2MRR9_9HYPH|nr:hypothetical protein [Rhizobium binae]MBX4993859.1 hypothetical protein [Rhizobium binae]QSY83265.1 hypothetical protein J2J99_05465 [Rhizobium binae]
MVESMDPKLPETQEDELDRAPSEAPEDPGIPHEDGTLFADGVGYAE